MRLMPSVRHLDIAFPGMSTHGPLAVLADCPIHRIRGKVEVAGPADGAQRDVRLPEQRFVAQHREHASARSAGTCPLHPR